jgi:hypothetical protein
MNNLLKLVVNLVSTAITVAIVRWYSDGNTYELVSGMSTIILFQVYNTEDRIKGD